MIRCQLSSPLAVLVTSCLIPLLLADSLSAVAAIQHEEGGTHTKQPTKQHLQQQQSQQQALELQQQLQQQSAAAGTPTDGEPGGDLEVDTRAIPRFVGKKDSGGFSSDEMERLSRAIPRFVGKKDSGYFVGDEMDRLSRAIPRFVGKKRAAETVSAGILADDHRVEKRAVPRFVGKREYHYVSRGAPYFIGKRSSYLRTIGDIASSHYPSELEYLATLRGSEPNFIANSKNPSVADVDAADNDPEDEFVNIDERSIPRFVGRRGAPRFVGKRQLFSDEPYLSAKEFLAKFKRTRSSPHFIGKRTLGFDDSEEEYTDLDERGAPRFVGKRGAPRFVGKRDSTPYLSAQEFKAKFRREDPYFIGKRTLDFGEESEEAFSDLDERGAPRFVGKRGAPRFVGKRGVPRFVGKRRVPMFVGKREQQQQQLYEQDETFEPRSFLELDSEPEISGGAFPMSQQRDAEEELAERRQEAVDSIRSKLRKAEELLQKERSASEAHADESAASEDSGVSR